MTFQQAERETEIYEIPHYLGEFSIEATDKGFLESVRLNDRYLNLTPKGRSGATSVLKDGTKLEIALRGGEWTVDYTLPKYQQERLPRVDDIKEA